MRSRDQLAHLEGLDALRGQFPNYNNRNSPRIIALARETAAQAAESSGRDAAGTLPGTNAPVPVTPGIQPSAH